MITPPDSHRSFVMGQIHSKGTKPEMMVRRGLYALGYRYRVNVSNLPGKPDIVFASRHKIILVNGCFWHGHKCKKGNRIPSTNKEYWLEKINNNVKRDLINLEKLVEMGWEVYILWECEIRQDNEYLAKILNFLNH
jgi:DNA mismatch endonuclease (patch repair protein)